MKKELPRDLPLNARIWRLLCKLQDLAALTAGSPLHELLILTFIPPAHIKFEIKLKRALTSRSIYISKKLSKLAMTVYASLEDIGRIKESPLKIHNFLTVYCLAPHPDRRAGDQLDAIATFTERFDVEIACMDADRERGRWSEFIIRQSCPACSA